MSTQALEELQQRMIQLRQELNELEVSIAEELRKAGRGENGLTFAELLTLPESFRQILLELQRAGDAAAFQLAEALGDDLATLEAHLQDLIQQGYVIKVAHADEVVYRLKLGAKRPARLPADIWNTLERRLEGAGNTTLNA